MVPYAEEAYKTGMPEMCPPSSNIYEKKRMEWTKQFMEQNYHHVQFKEECKAWGKGRATTCWITVHTECQHLLPDKTPPPLHAAKVTSEFECRASSRKGKFWICHLAS